MRYRQKSIVFDIGHDLHLGYDILSENHLVHNVSYELNSLRSMSFNGIKF